MKRNYKRELARRMMTQKEIKEGVSPYDSKAWEVRKKARQNKEIKKMQEAAKRREAKKLEKKGGVENGTRR